jgi:hypothetical protein
VTVWRGTLRPKTDADLWLALAFSQYERHAALANALQKQKDREPVDPFGPAGETKVNKNEQDRQDRLGVSLLTFRSLYELGARGEGDVALSAIKKDLRKDGWHRIGPGKGVLLLDALRAEIEPGRFDAAMASFGKAHGGKEVTTAQFFAHMAKPEAPARLSVWKASLALRALTGRSHSTPGP